MLVFGAVVLAAAAAWAAVSWLVTNWWALILLAAAAVVGAAGWAHWRQQQRAWDRARQQALRFGLPELDALHHRALILVAARKVLVSTACGALRGASVGWQEQSWL
ncbi:hypothetical protein SPW_0408 [Streptomyces sp. W007]|uniref:hypothetical protein n=1 Tax=Streptomyces sp. W007 TaxID=1055352 RepID=UPI000241A117|nr:hypothetical protein [Streptomyces sp. W007]EHM31195.1 hypothetical protein SPW_0408 [Streptomyces sp. W007]